MMFIDEDVELLRQWFDVIEDINPQFLGRRDFELAKQLYQHLGRRVSSSIERGIAEQPELVQPPRSFQDLARLYAECHPTHFHMIGEITAAVDEINRLQRLLGRRKPH
jgi:hypothetical protein